ncbi:hypothetical protein Moror_13686 [Moniliophthora roreri MCA 2997]|uniref:Uncharacterized protein n=2 Tax=Moniliophthora roreri TaxID=221103 RepID=V2XC39_MONRO|nr:hypothetical protein Moror_13686 [Moniliophthora roreri MCA 2997]KAI3600706.1 hypothetical protein WG66_014198 [Moniliophthora roreri]
MSVNSSQVTLIIDATAENLIPSNSIQWQNAGDPFWYGGTARWAAGTSLADNVVASCSMTFSGTSISFSGNTPIMALVHTTFGTDIDGQQSTWNYTEDFVNTEWFTSPTLSDGQHRIVVTNLDKSVVDYVLITAGPSTPLSGNTAAVDDTNVDEIWYHGQWSAQTNQKVETGVNGSGRAPARPMKDSVHRSTNAGDSFEFRFAGTSIAVYGLLDITTSGNFSIDFTLDGSVVRRGTFPQEDGHKANGYLNLPNYLFFENKNITAGNHTLLVNVTAVEGSQSFQLDYITYDPSFDLLNQKPAVIGNAPTSSTGPSGTATPPTSNSQATSSRAPIGAIVGGTIGGVALLLIVGLLLFCRRKRTQGSEKAVDKSQWTVEPFEPMPVVELKQPLPPSQQRRHTPSGSEKRQRSYQSTTAEVYSLPHSGGSSSTSPSTTSPGTDSQRQVELHRRTEEIASLTSQLEQSRSQSAVPVDVGELHARIDMLTRENQRLVRDYVLPPEYAGSDVGVGRPQSFTSATLPSYENRS